MKIKSIIISTGLLNILPFTNIGYVYSTDTSIEQTTIASSNELKLSIIQDTLLAVNTMIAKDFRTIESTVTNGVIKMFTGHTSLTQSIYDRNCRKLPAIASEIVDFYSNSLHQTYTEEHWLTFKQILNNLTNHYRKNITIINKTVTKSIESRPEKTADIHDYANPLIEENTKKKERFKSIKDNTREKLERLC